MARSAIPEGALVLSAVTIALDGREIVAVDAVVAPGEILTLMGPSGSGKSSLLAYLSGTLAPVFRVRGEAWLAGRRIDTLPTEARRTGLLFQDDLLFPHLSVTGNLGFAIPRSIARRAERTARIATALEQAGLAGLGDRDPATLSGGQRARVALMRVLLSEPQALLLDEPFSKLDAALRQQFRALVFAQAGEKRLPMVLVTHDPADADAAGGPVIRL